jgi:hypothetical protein
MAQQYSSSTFVSMHFHSLKEKFDTDLKDVTISPCLLFKLRKSELAYLETV